MEELGFALRILVSQTLSFSPVSGSAFPEGLPFIGWDELRADNSTQTDVTVRKRVRAPVGKVRVYCHSLSL